MLVLFVMLKNRFNPKTLIEVVEELKSERTSQGDTITLVIEYPEDMSRPRLILKFDTFDPEKKNLPNTEEITSFLPENPWYERLDDTTGKPLPGEFRRGFGTWREYFHDPMGAGAEIQRVIRTGGRNFVLEEKGL